MTSIAVCVTGNDLSRQQCVTPQEPFSLGNHGCSMDASVML